MTFLPFDEARKFARKLGLKSQSEWIQQYRSGKLPINIPRTPERVYKNSQEWKGWGDWLGTGRIANQYKEYRRFGQAKVLVRRLGLKTGKDWISYCKSGKKPDDIPNAPWHVYKDEWEDVGDWLGTGNVAPVNRIFRPFKIAREFVRSLKLKDSNEWKQYCKSRKKPYDIPSNPHKTYSGQWHGIGDWLGTGSIATFNKRFLPYEEAREFVRSQGLKNYDEWRKYRKQGKPDEIPSNPGESYGNKFKGYGDWLGTDYVALRYRKYRSFEKAKNFVRGLNLQSRKEWMVYCKSGKKPDDIPSSPDRKYMKEWNGMGDWLGTGYVATYNRTYRRFDDAKAFVQKLGLKSGKEWKAYCKSGKKPHDIPSSPIRSYKKDWNGMGDWLGTGYVAPKDIHYKSFDEARAFARGLKLKDGAEWRRYCKSQNKPKDIPAYPEYAYQDLWDGIGDWLGTGYVAPKDRRYWPFQEAREFVHGLKLNNRREWKDYYNSGKKPSTIPSSPAKIYKKDWNGMGDWLGTGYIAHVNRNYLPFNEAKKFVHKLGLNNVDDWKRYCKVGNKPFDIPNYPNVVYEPEWMDWFDWLGTKGMTWDIAAVKELLRDLIESRTLYDWDEAVLYSFLLRRGVLNLGDSNRHKHFFKNLIEACRTEEGRKQVEDYIKSDSKAPPDFSKLSLKEETKEIVPASLSEISNLVDTTDPLNYKNISPVEQVLKHTQILESINVDEEAMQFLLNYSVDELWKCAFKNESETVKRVKLEGKNGNKYHDAVVNTFLTDYEQSRAVILPSGYSFPFPPTLMQLYVTHKVNSQPYFGNFSGTGSGKTLSAILASRIIDSKLTIIVCPNDVVDQWKRTIVETFPDSEVVTGKDAFYVRRSKEKHRYAVLNYDKFSQEDSPNLAVTLAHEQLDFAILDEVHFTKIRDEDVSIRRTNLEGLMTLARKKNASLKVLGLSATPVVNNLREGRSLLELITGKIYDDISVSPTIPNSVTLYEKLSTISIRELPNYSADVDTHIINVTAQGPGAASILHLRSNPLAIEKFLTKARIPEIISHIEGQTIIYTEYVDEIIDNLSRAVKNNGHSFALYTGFDRTGLSRFLEKKVQVLIASRPLSVGIDGLQHICNRLIINTLPWTNAQYQQLLGRLVRKGQIRDVVHVYLVKASIDGYHYDELKWKRIQFKRTLADCAVDGRLPQKNLVTPQQAAMEAVRWLERLERGDISTVTRKDLNVELTPVEIKNRIIKYGDFTKLNNKINSEKSGSTHSRMVKEPREWEEYHRQYREARNTWRVIPYDEIIKRIKQLSPRLMIGDFGCGEAKMLEEFGDKRVYSFDHIAINNKVTACDMKSTGLPDEAIDIAIFSLSLMGRNWDDYIAEAKRCLATGGYLLVAETTKSIKGRLSSLREIIIKEGFEIYSEEAKGDFTFIEAREM